MTYFVVKRPYSISTPRAIRVVFSDPITFVQFDWGAPGIVSLLIVFHKFYPNMIHLQVYKLDLRRYCTLLMSLLEK